MPLDDLPNRHVALLPFWGVIPGAAVVQAHTSMLSRKAATSSAISSAWVAVAKWPVSRRQIEERWSAHLDDARPTAANRRQEPAPLSHSCPYTGRPRPGPTGKGEDQ
jgi:hypothetical protein